MNAKLTLMHVGFAAVAVAALLVASIPQVHSLPFVGEALVGVAGWAWGKMGFKPSKAVLAQILSNMPSDEIEKLTNPPPRPTAVPPTA